MKNSQGLFILFLVMFTTTSFVCWISFNNYYWFINTYMWSPALAAFSTLIIQKKHLKDELPWKWGKHKYHFQSFLIPFLYTLTAYVIGYLIGFGEFGNPDYLDNRLERMGLDQNNSWLVVLLFGTVFGCFGTLYNMASSLGEEVGWRGFLLPKLLKKTNFFWATLIAGTIWAVWHYPLMIINTRHMDNIPWLAFFSFWLGMIGTSFIYTYYFIKSKSLWTAVIIHSSHNYFVGAYFSNITINNDFTGKYLGETGIFFAGITVLFGIYFALKTKKLNHG